MLVINNVNVKGKAVNVLIEGDRVVSVGKRTRANKGRHGNRRKRTYRASRLY